MALPTLVKTWQYDKNNQITTGDGSGYGELMYTWKTIMTSWGSSPWTVVASSDASSAGAADYWTSPSACNTHRGSGVAHCWIVLQQDGVASGFQICVDLNENGGGADSVMNTYVSESAGFTGGTVTNRPTATDEVNTFDGVGSPQWVANETLSTTPAWISVFQSTDGSSTRWCIWVNNQMHCFFCIEKPSNTPAGWTLPWLTICAIDRYAGTNYRPTYSYLNDAKNLVNCRAGGARHNVYLSSEGVVTSMLGQLQTFGADLDSSAWPMFPIGLWCDESGARGRIGTLDDIYWGSTSINDGDHYPGDASRLWVQLGDIIQPWGGGAAIVMA